MSNSRFSETGPTRVTKLHEEIVLKEHIAPRTVQVMTINLTFATAKNGKHTVLEAIQCQWLRAFGGELKNNKLT